MSNYTWYNHVCYYNQRSYAWKLLRAATQLLVTGRCQLAIYMEHPRDVAMFAAGEAAGLQYDIDNGQAFQSASAGSADSWEAPK